MGEYRIVRHSSNEDYLEHAIFGFGKKSATTTGGTGNVGGRKKGWQKQGAAYLARAWLGGKWRYAYTDAEVKWLQNWGKPKKGTNINSKEYKDYEKKLKTAQKQNKEAQKQVDRSELMIKSNLITAKDEAKRKANDAVHDLKETSGRVKKAVTDTVNDVKNSNVTKYAGAKAEKAKDLGEYAARSLFDKEFREAGKDPTKYDARRAELDRELRDDDKNAEKAKQNIQKEQEKKAKEKQREKEKAAKAAEKEAKKAEKAAEKEAREAERRAEAEKEAAAKSKLTDSGSGGDRTEPKGGDGDDVVQEKTSLLDRGKAALRNAGRDVADDAGRLRRKAKMSLGNITDKAKETVSGFKNYSEDVDKREAENTQLMKDISSTRRQVQSEGAREAARSAHDEAVKNATDIQKEKSSLKYKLSDLMSKGKDSETFKSGKREAELLLDREGKPLLNKASKALDKGKEWAGDAANKASEKAGNLANKAKEKISEVGADSRNYSAAKKALTNAEAKYAQATEDYNKAMEKYKKAGANPLVRNELDAAIAAQKKAAEERQTAQTNFKRVQESTSSTAEGLDNTKSGLKDIFGRAASSAKERGAQAMESLSKQSKEESGGSSTASTGSTTDKSEESKSGSDSAKSGSLKERVKAAVDKYAGPVINKLKGLDNATSPADRKEKLNAVKEAMETLEEKARERLKTYEDKGGKSSPEYQAAKMTYDQIDKMGTKIRGGQYGWVGSYDQIERMMKDGISEDDAFLFENYARASHELHRSMTEDEYNAWIADYNKKHGKNY